MLEAGQIGTQLRLAMQIHVERDDIQKRQLEVFGRRVVDIGAQTVGRRILRHLVQLPQKPLHPHTAKPPCHGGRHFVPESEEQHGGVAAQTADGGLHLPPDTTAQSTVIEKRQMLRPRHAHHQTEPVAGRFIDQRRWRQGVEPHRVEPELRDGPEIARDLLRRRKLPVLRVRSEGPVTHPLDEPGVPIETKELAACRRRPRRDVDRDRLSQVGLDRYQAVCRFHPKAVCKFWHAHTGGEHVTPLSPTLETEQHHAKSARAEGGELQSAEPEGS